MTVGKAFDDSVAYYDQWMKLALHSYDELFGVAVELMPFGESEHIKVLDLGAGTGLFSQHVLAKYARANFVLYDLAPKMLEIAQTRFKDYPEQFDYVEIDYRDFKASEEYDLVISSLSIHHLQHDEKKALFKNVHKSLKKDGVFINVDQVKGPTEEMQEHYWSDWLRKVRVKGAAEEQIAASIERRKTYDIDSTLVEQLAWLSEAGFTNVDCVYKNYFIGVFFGEKREA